MSTNAKRSILIIITVIAVLFLLVKACQWAVLSNALKTNKEISELDSNTYTKNMPKEYSDLFLNKRGIEHDSSLMSRHRNPVTEFHNEQFYIQICKLDTINMPLNKILNESNNSSERSLNTYYVDGARNKQFEIIYKLGRRPKLTKLNFAIYGDEIQIIKMNDTVAYYYSNLENFSLKYQEESEIDVFGKVKDNFKNKKVPVEIMFLKRNNNLYFIFLSNKDYSANLDLYALYNLIIPKNNQN